MYQYHAQRLTEPDGTEVAADSVAAGLQSDEIAVLRGEAVALQSLLYGLCMGLSQMGEVHREVVVQAFDYADRSPMAVMLKDAPDNERSTKAFWSTIGRLKELIVSRIRSAAF